MNEITLNSNTCNGLISASESEQAVPCRDVVHWFSTARSSGRKTAAARSGPQPGECLKGDLVHLFNFSDGCNARILITFLRSGFQTRIFECVNFSTGILR
jgi:hypothetical protein